MTITRKKSLPRSRKPLKRSPVRKTNTARRKREWLRAYGSPERVFWIKRQPCVVSGVRGDIDNVHVRAGGASLKADACWIVPMAHDLHEELHRIGKRSFEKKFGVDLDALAQRTEERWQQERR